MARVFGYVIPLTWVLCLFVTGPVAKAQDVFRCGSSLIGTGLTTAELLRKCGEPDAKESTDEVIRARNSNGGSREIGTTTVERWTYNRARGQFPALLTIEDGVVKRIEFLER